MKIRTGFVSNSSSSSFLAVTTRNPRLLKEISNYIGLPEEYEGWLDEYADSYWKKDDKSHKLTSGDYGRFVIKGTDIVVFDSYEGPAKIGLDIEEALRSNRTIDQCRVLLVKQLSSIGITTSNKEEESIDLDYGEWGTE